MTFTDLADAMLLGCKIAPRQGFGTLFSIEEACAWGAIYHGLGIATDVLMGKALTTSAGMASRILTDEKWTSCPASGHGLAFGQSVAQLIIHLNDDHQWSREKIAGWLISLDHPEKPADDYNEEIVRRMFADVAPEPVAVLA